MKHTHVIVPFEVESTVKKHQTKDPESSFSYFLPQLSRQPNSSFKILSRKEKRNMMRMGVLTLKLTIFVWSGREFTPG